MKTFIALLALLTVVSAEVHQFNIGYRPNMRQRMNAKGKLAEYEKERNELLSKKSLQLASSSSPVIDYEDMAYMVQISLGSPAQNFVLFIDSGSSNLWVPDITCAGGKDATCGSYCKSTPYDACLTFCQEECCTKTVEGVKVLSTTDACQSKHRFNSSLSSSYVTNGQKFDMTYNTGEVKGFFGVDTFCFTNTSVCATGQVFGQATTIGEAFAKQPEDGIIGLGWPALAVNQQTPPLFNLMNQGKLDQPYFVVYLANIGPTSQINGGAFTVGGLDTTHCSSNVDWVPLSTQTFWQFKLGGVSSGSYSQAPNSGWQAAADTAASFIGAPKSVVTSLAKAVGATYVPLTGAFFMDCDAVVPDIVFTINGKTYNMPSTSFVVSAGPGPCMFAFYELTAGGFYPAWMLGPRKFNRSQQVCLCVGLMCKPKPAAGTNMAVLTGDPVVDDARSRLGFGAAAVIVMNIPQWFEFYVKIAELFAPYLWNSDDEKTVYYTALAIQLLTFDTVRLFMSLFMLVAFFLTVSSRFAIDQWIRRQHHPTGNPTATQNKVFIATQNQPLLMDTGEKKSPPPPTPPNPPVNHAIAPVAQHPQPMPIPHQVPSPAHGAAHGHPQAPPMYPGIGFAPGMLQLPQNMQTTIVYTPSMAYDNGHLLLPIATCWHRLASGFPHLRVDKQRVQRQWSVPGGQ